MNAILVAALLFFALPAQGATGDMSTFKAKILDKKNRENLLFNFKHETKVEGAERTVKNTFLSPEGTEVAVENVVFEGDKLKSYQQLQKQVGSDGKIEIQGDQVVFTQTQNGKTSSDKEKLKDNFVVGPTLIGYLQARWDEVMAGKTVNVRFGVIDRKETVGFSLKKEKDTEYGGKKAIVVKMKPTSFIIAALVDPLLFTLDAETGRVLELEGRVVPKLKDGDKWKDLDAVSVYEYPN